MRKWLIISTLAAAFGCSGSGDESKSSKPAAPAPTAKPAPVQEVQWLHDDYDAALAAAKQAGVPLVIDMWAQWCHTCISMKSFVLTDKSFAPMANRFVWLALDTDKEVNAAALAKYPVNAWPTFFVVSPGDESVQARYLGAASVKQFREFLVQGEQGHQDALASGGVLAADSPVALVRAGDRAAIEGEWKTAHASYMKALEAAPADWARRPDVLVSAMSAMYRGEDYAACVEAALASAEVTGNAASAADFQYFAMACADKLGDAAKKKAVYAAAETRLTALVADASAPLSLDDRSDAMRILREALHGLDRPDDAKAVAEKQRALLDKAAAEAKGAYVAAGYNWPRAEVYVYLGVGAELVPALEASEKALPDNYDPPYRLGWVQLQLGNHDAALAAADRSAALAYGPRAARVHMLRAAIHAARKDAAAEIDAWRKVVAIYEALPDGQKQPAAEANARKTLADLDKS